ncbi:ABC transporter substrate-binding protein [Paenibacillus eucommiae]|uniref:NitT/TauT family transport system substrate-binding protein n=1 Tax=Paenibacillus eucommiae TaxID=1355755 RepID=A0ABS4J944_9BACL|nr:ABC transporter substrate-binding protein [Paenibacillus eucommiae]MBP1996362.1 NitT/TauT family transport system substrate-binding protein [Paenibacillus eucommiae]
MKTKNVLAILSIILILSAFLSACGNKKEAATSPAPTPKSSAAAATVKPTETPVPSAPTEQVKLKQILDWFPQPTHGGLYAALQKNFYKDAGLDVTLEPGGPQVSATQIVASGKAEFGITGGDVVLQAREEGVPIIAVAALLQDSPAALFFHKGENIKTFEDLNGRKVQALLFAAYWQYVKSAFKLDKVEEINFTGQYANFIADKSSVIQGYITNTPEYLKAQGVEFDYLQVSSSGYAPYMSVIFTTEKFAKEHPETVKAYVEATIKGWNYYKDSAPEIHPAIVAANSSQTVESLNIEAVAQTDFVYGGDAKEHGVGYMTAERWNKLIGQLADTGVLKKKVDASEVFTTEFLPKQ